MFFFCAHTEGGELTFSGKSAIIKLLVVLEKTS